jgi:alpha-tubulin suppressor-like RCC1 family protein
VVTCNGQLFVWGRHTYSNAPHAVPLPSPVLTVACGAEHMAAVAHGGALWTWGYNEKGQLGHGDTFDGLRRPRRVRHFARAADCDAEDADDLMSQLPQVRFASITAYSTIA